MFENFDLKKALIWGFIILLFIYLVRKLILSIKYGEGKTVSYESKNLKHPKSFYEGHALALFNSLDGVTDNPKEKRNAIDNILELNDDEIILVNNTYNAKFTSGSDTMSTDIYSEWSIDIPFVTDSVKRYRFKAKALGIG